MGTVNGSMVGSGVGVALFVLAFGASACSAHEKANVRQLSASRLRCPAPEIEMALNRETPKVREWVAGCDFMYTRIHCTEAGCSPAEPEPPCFGNLPCFKEDPVTLEWVLDESGPPGRR